MVCVTSFLYRYRRHLPVGRRVPPDRFLPSALMPGRPAPAPPDGHCPAGEPRLTVGVPAHVLGWPPRGGLSGISDAQLQQHLHGAGQRQAVLYHGDRAGRGSRERVRRDVAAAGTSRAAAPKSHLELGPWIEFEPARGGADDVGQPLVGDALVDDVEAAPSAIASRRLQGLRPPDKVTKVPRLASTGANRAARHKLAATGAGTTAHSPYAAEAQNQSRSAS